MKTPISLKVGKHVFLRYLMSNEYAEEMKCSKCGFVIWPCYTEKEGISAVEELGGKVNECN